MKEKILEILSPLIILVLKQVLKPLLCGLVDRNPVHGKVVLASLYPIVDVELEPLTLDTETPIDDNTIKAIKEVIIDVAREKGIPLSELDGD